MVSIEKHNELLQQLTLALAIVSGRKRLFTQSEYRLLRVETGAPFVELQIAAEEILMEALNAALPQPEDLLDLYSVAYDFLMHIQAEGGMIRRNNIPPIPWLDDDLIEKMEKDRLLVRGDGGLRWGFAAKAFVEKIERERKTGA
jgi:hypothetical protein